MVTEPGSPKVHGLEHAAICVKNMDRSLSFYCSVLGLPKLDEKILRGKEAEALSGKSGASVRLAILGNRFTGRIELMQFEPEGASEARKTEVTDIGRIVEVALRVSGIDPLLEIIAQKGHPCVMGPMDIEMDNTGKARIAYLRDPDNVLVELVEVIRGENS